MFERFAQAARVAVDDARYEAARRGDRRIGTDHLLISLLEDESNATALGVDAGAARAAADGLDRAALAAVGVDADVFGTSGRPPAGRHMPLTAGAKTFMGDTLTQAAAEKARSITPRHMMLAILERHEPDPAAVLLGALAVDVPAARERLADTADAGHGK
ncbi:Clp protease N-terminal domain-containing protein [Gryllotalpicola reticulitermitis]|uniref:Clp protease N-terminal domain-containing protein n=1 Tax=Gryllotalpicola reticulitermitis TaxID=1184153 RepID=A0ABV8Q6G0_9MICO